MIIIMKCILGQHLKLSHLQLLHCIILIVLVGRISRVSRETSPLLSADENDNDLQRVRSNASRNSIDTQANFRFSLPMKLNMPKVVQL